MVLERPKGGIRFQIYLISRILWPLEAVVIAELIQQVAIMY